MKSYEKLTPEGTRDFLFEASDALRRIERGLSELFKEKGYKNGYVLWPIRTALSGKQMTPAGATEILEVLGKEESIKRIQAAIEKLGK